jgi:hypothetical protein
VSEGAEKSASGGADAARTDVARTDAAREWRGARAAGRVVLALIAAAVLLATWAMSPGLLTRTVEAELAHARDGTHEYWSGARLAWGDGDSSADERRGGAMLKASITGANARIGVPRWVVWIELTQYGRGTVGACGRLVDRVAGHEISRRELGQVVTHVGSHEDLVLGLRFVACGVVLLVMAAVLKVVKHVGHVGTGGTPVPRERVGVARLVGMAPIVVIAAWTVASPTMMCPDSVDYVANAMRLMDTGSFAHFDGWRSPGYSIVLLGLLAFGTHVAMAAGVLNAVMVIATMLLSAKACWLIVREGTGSAVGSERLAAWAAAAVMWVIALDPWVMLWTRHVMPECASMLVVAVVVRVLVGMGVGRARGAWRDVAIGAALGLFAGGACYVRGNFQLLVACVPMCVGVCVLARGAGWWRAVVVGGVCGVCGVGILMPWVVRTHERTGAWSFTTGGQFAKALFAQETGLMDWNQSEAFEFDHMLRLAAMRDEGALGAYAFVHEMNTGKLAGMGDAGLPQLVNTDRRAKMMVEESLARRPAMRNELAVKAMSTQLGVWAFDVPGYRENAYWAGALRASGGDVKGPTGGDNQWAEAASQTHLPWELVEKVHARTTRSIEGYRDGAAARGFDAWWRVGAVVRIVVAWAGVIGVVGVVLRLVREAVYGAKDAAGDGAWLRGAVCMVLIAGLVAAHGAAIAWVVMTGLDRYAVAMIPASAVATVGAWGLLMRGVRWRVRGVDGARGTAPR